MTKPRVISRDAIRRAKRQGVTYIQRTNLVRLGFTENGERDVDYTRETLTECLCGVYQRKRTDNHLRGTDDEYRILPIGRGGNRKGHIDGDAWNWDSYRQQVEHDYYS